MKANGKYTIVLPVRNGGHYVKQCVDSILSQTLADFDLLILENSSTDGTADWLTTLHDSRIRIVSAATPLSIEENWARAVGLPKNEFMTLLGHDDLLAPNYLEVMDALIRREPEASLYFAHFHYIDENGNLIRHCRPLPARETAAEYIAALFTGERDTWGAGYMMRSALYDEVGGIPKHEKLLFADDALWITLMHKSWKATAEETCFSVRQYTTSTGATGGESWFGGMQSYITFLEGLAQQDPEVAQAYATHGPAYFYHYCYVLYMHALVKATKSNQRLDAQRREAILSELARVSPQGAQELRNSKKIRLHEAVNRNRLARRLYQIYSSLRGGQEAN